MRISNISLSVLAAVVLFSCSKVEMVDKQLIPQLELASGKAPLFANDLNAKYIPGEYIVVFKDDVDVDQEVGRSERANGFKAKFKFKYAFKGFSASLPTQALEGLRNNPKVNFIEQDQEVQIISTQANPTWGIDRIDQNSLPLSKSYTYVNTGAGVTVYVFDTGIRFDHNEFTGGRAVNGIDLVGADGVDLNGHGTHVAGTIGGISFGVAKGVKLVSVRVLGASGSGSLSAVISGLDWAIINHDGFPAVGNMSLGSSASASVDLAVNNAISDGIIMCVAAGNSSRNASQFSPARVVNAITVGATTLTDGFASYSNYGSVVDILAPGSSITSSWYRSTTDINTISGTSMAAPHVAGVAALYLESNPTSSPAAVQSELITKSSIGKIKLSSVAAKASTPNRLLNSKY